MTESVEELRNQVKVLRSALQKIVDVEPEQVYEPLGNEDCADCQRAKDRNWPPSRLCDVHSSRLNEQDSRNERRRNNESVDMRRIARDALEGRA